MSSTSEPTRAIKVFYSYAFEDKTLQNTLVNHLTPMKHLGLIIQWHDRDIRVGRKWAEEIYYQLNAADIILLLVSPAFMRSDFCYNVEMPQALKRYKAGEAIVIPIILRPVHLQGTPIGELQMLPTGGKPVTTWRNRDEAFFDVTKVLFKEVSDLLSQKWLEESNVFHAAQRYDDALIACEQAIRLDSKNLAAYMSKGSILWHLNRLGEALEAYELVIHLDPQNIIAYMSKGYVLLNLGLYEEALIACEQVIRLDLDNAIAYLIKGRILELLAAQAYKKVREIGPGNLQVYSSSKNFIVNMEGYKSQLEPQIVTEEINEPEQR